MTHTELKRFRFGVGDTVKMFDQDDYCPEGKWVYGTVVWVGDGANESDFDIQWEDLQDPTTYPKHDCDQILHH